MKVDLTQTIIGLDGNTMPHVVLCAGCRGSVRLPDPLTLGTVIMEALTATLKCDKGAEAKDKLERFSFAQRFTGDTVDLDETSVKRLLDRVDKAYEQVVIVGRVYEMLGGDG